MTAEGLQGIGRGAPAALWTVALALVVGVPLAGLADEVVPAGEASPPAAAAPHPEQGAPAAAPAKRLDILDYRVEGAHLLSQREIETAIYPFLGPDKTSDDVEQARAALEKAYAAKGYQTVAVSIPPQQVTGGVVTLAVTEGTVGRLRVKGSQYHDIEAIKEAAPSLAEGTVPNFNAVSTDIVALNQQADRKVTPSLRAGATPGTVDVDLTVEDQLPLHGSLEFNNRSSANTTPYRLNASIGYDNLWQMGHSLKLSYQVAPENPDDTKVFSASYLARVPGWDKVAFLVYGVDQNSTVNTLGSMDVAGPGQLIGTRAVITLPGDEGFFETLSTGIDYKNFHEVVSLAGSTSVGDTPITYWPLTTTWSGTWQGDGALTQVNAGVTFTFRGLGSDPGAWDNKRDLARGDFLYFRGDVSHTRDLPNGMQLFARVSGQAANAPLISNEQFAAGGLDTVRGYLESEVLGDEAVLGSVEFRSPSLSRWLGEAVINEWRVYTFAEGGRLTIRDPMHEQTSVFDLGSFGIGSRGKFLDYLNGSVDLAFPLVTQNPTKAYDPRLTFRLWSEF